MSYNNEEISALKGEERVRRRPSSVLGSNGLDGAKHCVKEIIGNSLDEASSGFGDKLEVCLWEDGGISVRDFGRGIPMGYNSNEKEWNWKLIFEELYAGGKYKNHQDILKKVKNWNTFDYTSIPYLFSVGLNGLGSAAVQYTSEYMTVISFRDGVASEMRFESGKHIWEELKVYETEEPDGTFVHWKSDSRHHDWGQVFTDVNIDSKWLAKLCKQVSISAEIAVKFTDKQTGKVLEFEKNSIKRVLEDEVGSGVSYKELLYHEENKETGDIEVCLSKVAIGKQGGGFGFFHNNIEINGGVHYEGLTLALAMFIRDLGLDKLVKQQDYLYKFSIVVSSYSNVVSYRNQTKDSLDNEYVKEGITRTIRTILSEAWTNKEKWVVDAIKEAQEEAEIRKQLEEQKKKIKDAVKATKTKVKPDKFVSCMSYEKGRSHEVELFLLEGDSASSSFKMARDSQYQCFLPLRGKGLNLYKASIDKIFKNEEVLSIMNVLGCGVDLDIENEQLFNINNLKVGKIIILSDADLDGLHIRILIFLLIYKLFPQLLYDGRVYVAHTPRYQVWLKDGSVTFCYDDESFNNMRKEGIVLKSNRFKGLGQVNSDVLRETTVAPEGRRLQSLKIEPGDTELQDTLEVLFGKSTDRRKVASLRKMLGGDFDSFEDAINKLYEDFNGFEVSEKGYYTEEVEF